jgi:RNA polymerase sigma-70 factor (ECF subfamily)
MFRMSASADGTMPRLLARFSVGSTRCEHLYGMRAVHAGAIEGSVADSLVARAASGDEIAFAQIVATHHDDMVRVSFIVCREVQLAQEAAGAAWSIAWRKLSSVRDPAKLRPWLLAIAANEARGLVRRRGRRTLLEIAVDPLPENTAAPDANDPAERIALIDLVNALSRLDPSDRAVVGLSAAGLSSSEIGQAIGLTPSGVRARLGRVMARLREDLRDG